MNTTKIMHIVDAMCRQQNCLFPYAEQLLQFVPMPAELREQVEIWEVPYAEDRCVSIYFYFGDNVTEQFCIEVGIDNNEFFFVLLRAVEEGCLCSLHKLPLNYFGKEADSLCQKI